MTSKPGPVGLAVVLLHPLPFDGRCWAPVCDRLSGLRTYAPTIYRLGDSLEEVAASILDRVDTDRLVVVGNSIGGSCALEIAAAAPDRVEHLVLVGTNAGHRPEPDYHRWAKELLATGGVPALWNQVWAPLLAARIPPDDRETAKQMALSVPPEDIARGIDLFHTRRDRTHVVDSWLGGLTAVSGAEDTAPGPHRSRNLALRAAKGRYLLIGECGHFVPIERAAAMARVIGDVVSGLPAKG